MSKYGAYETVGERRGSSGFSTVWLARAAGSEGKAAFAIKSVEPLPHVAGPEEAAQRARTLLESANVQARVACAEGTRHWAPVHEQGSTAEGAFYVTDYYPRTVASLIRAKAKLAGRSLLSLVGGIVAGLRELDRVASRPHGNLKPTNVFVLEALEGVVERVVLADPLPAVELDAAATRAADMAALGDIIFRLVCHRPFQAVGDWPVADGPQWSNLGKSAGGWRELCNLLMSPNLASSGLTLDEIAGRLAKIGEAEKGIPKGLVIAAVTGAVVVAAVLVVFLFLRGAPPAKDDVFAQLGEDYTKWLGALANASEAEINADLWNHDENLKKVLERRDTVRDVLRSLSDDDILASGLRTSYEDLTDGEKRKLMSKLGDHETSGKVAAASNYAAEIREAVASWNPEQVIQDCRTRYQSRAETWRQYADRLSNVTKPALDSNLVDRIERVAALTNAQDGLLARIEGHWAQIEKTKAQIENAAAEMGGTQDPILACLAGYVDKQVGNAASSGDAFQSLEAELARLADLAGRIGERVDGVWKRVDREYFIEESAVHKKFREGALVVDRSTFEDWMAAVGSQDYLVDEKLNPFADAGLDNARDRISKLVDDAAGLVRYIPEQSAAVDAFRQSLDASWAKVESGRVSSVSPKSRERESQRKAAVQAELGALEEQLGNWKDSLEKPAAGEDPRAGLARLKDALNAEIARVVDESQRNGFLSELQQIAQAPGLGELLDLGWIAAYERPIADSPVLADANKRLEELSAKLEEVPKYNMIDPRPDLVKSYDRATELVRETEALGAVRIAQTLQADLSRVVMRVYPDSAWESADFTRRKQISDAADNAAGQLEPVVRQAEAALSAIRPYLAANPPFAGQSGPISEFWRSKLALLLRDASTADELAGIDKWVAALTALEKHLPQQAEDASAGSLLVSLNKVFGQRRDGALARELAPVETLTLDQPETIGDKVGRELTELGKEVSQLAGLAGDVKIALDEACAASDMMALHEGLRSHKLFGDFEGDLAGVTARLSEVGGLEAKSGGELLQVARSAADPAVAFNAWRKVDAGGAWPGAVADVGDALAITDHLFSFVRSGEWLRTTREERRAELAGACRRYLRTCINQVAAGDKAVIDRGIGLLRSFVDPNGVLRRENLGEPGPENADLTQELSVLQDLARYDVNLWDFDRWVQKDGWLQDEGPGTNEEKIKKGIEGFLATPVAQAIANLPQVDAFRKSLEAARDIEKGTAMESVPWPAPPGWQRRQGPDDATVIYSLKRGASSHELTFRRISVGDQEVFLCATEVSLGLFGDVVTALGKWEELTEIWQTPTYMQSWAGPRVWEWFERSDNRMVENSAWWLQPPTDVEPATDYEARRRSATDMPSRKHPMQYVSPEAAKQVAEWLGFRLPTASEWRAAWTEDAKPTSGNLRDKRWQDLVEKIRAIREKGFTYTGPDDGIFALGQGSAGDAVVSGADDGQLWFGDVSSGSGKFPNIVGNVAELVYKDDGMQSFCVIGGSALSPPELWGGPGKPFDVAYECDKAPTREYSDVGFRLAFTAPRKSIAQALRETISQARYIGVN